jgi:hypothetical protein
MNHELNPNLSKAGGVIIFNSVRTPFAPVSGLEQSRATIRQIQASGGGNTPAKVSATLGIILQK